MHVIPSLPFNDICPTQLKALQQQLNVFFNQYTISIGRKTNFLYDLKQLFIEMFKTHLPASIEERALYERAIVQSIRFQFKENQLILRRTADQLNIFYLMNIRQFTEQAYICMQGFDWCERIGSIDSRDPLGSSPVLKSMCSSIDSILLTLRRQSRLQEHQLQKMTVKRSNLRLPDLYFLPESTSTDQLILKPFFSSCRGSPIQPLASYLNNMLLPLYEKHTQATTIFNCMDFIEKLAHFDDYAFLPHTSLVTFKILDVYTRMSHIRILEALGRFLSNVLTTNRHQNLTIDTVQQLTSICLNNNLFTYDGHLYRFIKGSPLSLPLTRTLANIYLHDWQASLVGKLNYQEEFYGRYHDNVFLSWQSSLDRLQILLNELDSKHPDIHIEVSMGLMVNFLGAQLENQDGKLQMKVYHDPKLPRFVLPFVMGHPRLLYRQWFQWAMRRAIYYCTSMEDFEEERIRIELTMLSHGYSLNFVKLNMDGFLNKYRVNNLFSNFNSRTYRSLRQQFFNSMGLERQHRQQQQEWKINRQLVHLQYIYDWGPRCQFNERFKALWTHRIESDSTVTRAGLKLKFNTIHCYPLNVLIAGKPTIEHKEE